MTSLKLLKLKVKFSHELFMPKEKYIPTTFPFQKGKKKNKKNLENIAYLPKKFHISFQFFALVCLISIYLSSL